MFPTFKVKFGDNVNGILIYDGMDWTAPGLDEYNKAHQAMFSRASQVGAVGVYACLEVSQQAVETVGEVDRKKIRDEIAKGPFQTIWGELNSRISAMRSLGGRAVAERGSGRHLPADKKGAKPAAISRSRNGREQAAVADSGQASVPGPNFCFAAGAVVILFEVFLNGVLLGGMYGLVALGLNLQYGVARIINLSYGEFFMGGAFAAFFTIMLWKYNPLLSIFISVPVAFVMNWLIYRFMMVPLVRRAPDQDALDADVVLVTFGLLFVFRGLGAFYLGRGSARLQLPLDSR